MQINIITDQPFPNGTASTNRILYYSKSFSERNEVRIFIISPTEYGKTNNVSSRGVHENIEYIYTCGTTIISRKFFDSGSLAKQMVKLRRNLLKLYGIIFAGLLIVFRSPKNGRILVYTEDNAFVYLYLKIISLIKHDRLVIEKNERPFFLKKSTPFTQLFINLYLRSIYRLFDGYIVISNSLKNYLLEKVSTYSKILIVPILYDSNDFMNRKNHSAKRYIAYSGVLNQEKDGIFTLIEAYADVLTEFPSLELHLIGDTPNTHDKNKLNKIIQEKKLDRNIKFWGFVPRQQMIKIISEASLLVLLKPDNIQTQYCFPSRIAEYLATEKPLLTTNIGEVKNYLTDKQNAFLCPPNDPNAVSKTISLALNDNNLCNRIGMHGKDLALRYFDYKVHSQKLNDFMETV